APEPGDSPAEDDAAAKAARDENAEAFVFVEQDPGNQSGEARLITAGFLGLLALHLFGLSWSEKRARRAGGEA
ncbi:MAG: hypothetical protein M3271_04090, partial [Actinomycetota bacterium]|nr:hypothetical protein [Actinomycetota bacterium]